MSFSMNIPLFKINEEQRLVYGRATKEAVDRAGEVMDYETSKPNFIKWSEDFANRTHGKSYGAIREQHDAKKAVGKIAKPLSFVDEEKAIDICVKVVDDEAWEKVKEGVLTSFSIGGSYGKQWTDDEGMLHYTAVPTEISLVDQPCLPEAVIEYVKADGSIEKKTIKKGEKTMDEMQKANVLEELQKTDETVMQDFKEALAKADTKKAFSFEEITNRLMGALKAQITTPFNAGYFWIKKTYADNVIICGDLDGDGDEDCYRVGYTMDADGVITLGKIEAVRAVWIPAIDEDNPAQEFGLPKAHKADETDELQKADENLDKTSIEIDEKQEDEVEDEMEKRDFTEEERKKLAEEGKAMPDGSFPIENKEDLKNAIRLAGQAKDKEGAIKFICRRARELGAEDMIPEGWTDAKKADEPTDLEKSEPVEKEVKVDIFEEVAKAMDKEDDENLSKKCEKLFHKMVEKGLHCKCDKCAKVVEEEKAEKADSSDDLHKAEATLEKADYGEQLSKAMSVIEDLKKGFDTLKSDNEALRKTVEKLENEPIPGGAMIAHGTLVAEKTVMGEGAVAAQSESAMLRKMFEDEKDPVLKQAMSERLAKEEMKKMFS